MRTPAILLLLTACLSACAPREVVRHEVQVERQQIPAALLRRPAIPEPPVLPPPAQQQRREATIGRYVIELRGALGQANSQLEAIEELMKPRAAPAPAPETRR